MLGVFFGITFATEGKGGQIGKTYGTNRKLRTFTKRFGYKQTEWTSSKLMGVSIQIKSSKEMV